MTRRTCLLGLVLGLLVRAAVIWLPGTLDVSVWKIWSFNAASGGVTRLYGVGGTPPERRLLAYGGRRTVVDYPPVALYELAVVGHIYRKLAPGFPDGPLLTAAVKAPAVLAEALLAAGMLFFARRWRDVAPAPEVVRWAVLAYWLNPGAIFDAALLGYLDPLYVLPAMASLVAAGLGLAGVSGTLFAVAVLTKAQGILIAPVLVLALWWSPRPAARGPAWRLGVAAASAALTTLGLVVPFAVFGALPNMLGALASLGRHDMLSGFAANLWWVVTYLMRAAYAVGEMGVFAAYTMPLRILAISTIVDLGYPNPRPFATLIVVIVSGWALWRGRRAKGLALQAGIGAFLVHAYFVLSVQVHENHLFLALPLLAIAAATRPRYRPVLFVLSGIFTLNLNLFYGVGDRLGYAIPRQLTVVDASVLLALANVAALVWHARVLRAECLAPEAPAYAVPSPGSA